MLLPYVVLISIGDPGGAYCAAFLRRALNTSVDIGAWQVSTIEDPEQERRSMTRESARRPRKSSKAPFQQPELLSNQREVAGEPGHQIARRTAEPAEASHTLRYGTTAKIENASRRTRHCVPPSSVRA